MSRIDAWGEAPGALIWSAAALTFTVASFLYFPVLEHLFGQTAGKWLLDVAVAPFTEKKQRAFDMVAGTAVVDVGSPR